jgi:predicted RNA methylase
MNSKTLLTVIVLGVVFLAGGVVTHLNVFPGSLMARAFNIAGLKNPNADAGGPIRYTAPAVTPASDQSIAGDTSTQGILTEPLAWKSKHLKTTINIPAGVFEPHEAEYSFLNVMENNPELFEGKRVMEIGTGSGIISLYAAKLGAASVIATDINPTALESVTTNAEALGFGDVIDARLVPLDDLGAYSVIRDDEQFDVIVSNPPFALDLDAKGNDAVTDTGELGFSIVDGLKDHLVPGGTVILFYDSLFYHQVMVKYARMRGYDVRSNNPNGMYGWAAEALFNSYLKRLLKKEGLAEDAISFNYHTDEALQIRYLRNFGLDPKSFPFQPLFDPPSPQYYYAGYIVIRN